MDDKPNVTYISLGGFLELHDYRYLWFTIMFSVYVLILCFNSTIVFLIWTHRNLHEPMYVFIAALLINSVLYSTNIYPKLLFDFLSDKPGIMYSLCLFQAFMYYSLSGSEFLLLSVMAYDRYVSICKPLLYPSIMTKPAVGSFLLLAWMLPACEMGVSILLHSYAKVCYFSFKGFFCNNLFYRLQCVISPTAVIYSTCVLVNLVFLPLLFIIFTYTRIFIITHGSSRAVRTKAAQTCFPHLLVLSSYSCMGIYDVLTVRLNSDASTGHLMSLQIILYHPLFNPIIYGLKMKKISKHLKKLVFDVKSHLSSKRFD